MFDFEKEIHTVESRIESLRTSPSPASAHITAEISRLETKRVRLLRVTYGRLTPAQRVQVARHEHRPHFKDYMTGMITDFTPLSGDRLFGDDHALIGGLGRFQGMPCVIMGHEKGHDLKSRLHHNFGMARPEGYRKAMRLMNLAAQFKLPVITLVDTAGAYPGVDAEARGQSEAIARSIETCLNMTVPLISVIVGEGGSGGAIAIAAANSVYMLENAVYSVISPEGCASILWRSAANASEAAAALKLTASDMMNLKLIDGIIEEPLGGAHRDQKATIAAVQAQIHQSLRELIPLSPEQLKSNRRKKFLGMGRDLPSHDDSGWFF